MKKILNKQISVKTMLILTFVIVFITTATAATLTTVQATLATNITIKYDGEVQTMKDANGEVVYPLSYQGTTYLPIRAVTNMLGLPVEWVAETNTVLLGKTDSQGKSTFDVATLKYGDWKKYTNVDDFPYKVDDFGKKLPHNFTYAYRFVGVTTGSALTFENANTYNTISFTLARPLDDNDTVVKFAITDNGTNTIIYETNISRGQFIEVVDLNIKGMKELNISAKSGGWSATTFILNPTVK